MPRLCTLAPRPRGDTILGATRKLAYTMTIVDARETLNGMHPLNLPYAHPVAIPGQTANTVQVVKACSAFEAVGCRVVGLPSEW